MLTLITGTPGAGKTLYAVWEMARKVPGSTVESNGEQVPRRLFTNIKDLVIDHERIDGEALNRWHEWAKPGDVILFDEVQEVWRPRAMGKEVPMCIQKLETHRHMGVDIILITQHPLLVDANIRRLVNLHFHVRRLAKKVALVYEWDHCSDRPGNTKTSLQNRTWFHPKEAYGLYKSAQLHTKPVTRVPRMALLLIPILGVFGFGASYVYARMQDRIQPPAASAKATSPDRPKLPPIDLAAVSAQSAASAAAGLPAPAAAPPSSLAPSVMGCIASATDCRCYDDGGRLLAQLEPAQCRKAVASVTTLVTTGSVSPSSPVPPSPDKAAPVGVAAASPSPAGVNVAGDDLRPKLSGPAL